MKIGIIGTGKLGTNLGLLWADKGHEILFGSRDPVRAKSLESTLEKDVKGRIKEIFTDISDVKNERNEVAHTYFRIKNDAKDFSKIFTAWPQHYKKGVFFSNNAPLDGEKLKELNSRCISVGDSISSLLTDIGAGVDFGNA